MASESLTVWRVSQKLKFVGLTVGLTVGAIVGALVDNNDNDDDDRSTYLDGNDDVGDDV